MTSISMESATVLSDWHYDCTAYRNLIERDTVSDLFARF